MSQLFVLKFVFLGIREKAKETYPKRGCDEPYQLGIEKNDYPQAKQDKPFGFDRYIPFLGGKFNLKAKQKY